MRYLAALSLAVLSLAFAEPASACCGTISEATVLAFSRGGSQALVERTTQNSCVSQVDVTYDFVNVVDLSTISTFRSATGVTVEAREQMRRDVRGQLARAFPVAARRLEAVVPDGNARFVDLERGSAGPLRVPTPGLAFVTETRAFTTPDGAHGVVVATGFETSASLFSF